MSEAKLTLPIQAGKKYVRRDGKVVEARVPESPYRDTLRLVNFDHEVAWYGTMVFAETGRIGDGAHLNDLVADFIDAADLPADMYLLASFKRSSLDGCVLWWGPNKAGYFTDLEQAGRYTLEEAQSICQSGAEAYTVPVPESWVEQHCRIRRVVDAGDHQGGGDGHAFWGAKELRAALAARSGD